MNAMVKTIKEVHKEDMCLFKSGGFYHVYGRDAYVLSYIFDYKIKNLVGGIPECGFPLDTLPKVKSHLEINKINFVVIDNRNNFMVDETSTNEDVNKYNEIYQKARNFINYKIRVNSINSFLLENIEKPDFRKILGKIEKIVDEERKIFSN